MEFELRGDPDGGPKLRLDHERFSYAGKFVMTNTGKAVAREGDDLIAAIAFNRDRTDRDVIWLRYVTVRADRQGEGIAPALADHVAERLLETADRLKIAVNNPFAYQALYKAGFGYTGDRTGIAELVLARPADRSERTYRSGLREFRDREDLTESERDFIEGRLRQGPPSRLDGR